MNGQIHSLSIIAAELAERGLTPAPENEAVVRRVVHATADFAYAANLRFTDGAVARGVAALTTGSVIVTDTNMALAGVSKPALAKLGGAAFCYMADPAVAAAAREAGTTRAVAAMRYAAARHPRALPPGRGGRGRGRPGAAPQPRAQLRPGPLPPHGVGLWPLSE